MERKITLNLFYVGLFSAFIAIILSGIAFQSAFKSQILKNLKNESKTISCAYDSFDSYDDLDLFGGGDYRITLIDDDGTVLYDNKADINEMGNHLNRPEVQDAIKYGSGTDTRISKTLKYRDFYYAIVLDDGNILRIAIATSAFFASIEQVIPIILIILLILLVFSMIFSLILSKTILGPLKKMLADIDDPEIVNDSKRVYPELLPVVKEIQEQRSVQESMRQEFTANVSHELKTPLTSISGYAEIIENKMASGDDVVRFAGKIRKEASRMLVLISDIIKLSKLDLEENTLNDDISLLSISNDVYDHLKDTADKNHIKIYIEGKSEIFKGNTTEIYELIYNLVDNSIKYNRTNGIIKIKIEDKKISVSDTGIGISKEDQERIFERFYRADKSRSRATGGTGLGLSICKHIAEHHNAKIKVESTLNVGTEIIVSF